VKKEPSVKKKLTYKEQKELDQLTSEIENLEKEKKLLEVEISSGTLKSEELISKSNRFGALLKLIDDKTMRWMELSESV
jgi:ATP-binding cassette subfamily F protein uup